MVTMHTWFEARISYDKIGVDDGKQKKATDVYILDACSFTEAEARAIEVTRPYMSGEFHVSSLKRLRISEIMQSDEGETWFKVRVLFVVLDQERGTEKKIPNTMLVQASDLKEARERIVEGMKGTLSDYVIVKIEETPILDVIPYAMPITMDKNGGEAVDEITGKYIE